MVIIKKLKKIREYDVKEAYGTDAKGVTIRWVSEKRTGGPEYLHNFALRYFAIQPGGYIAPHRHPWEQEIVITKGCLKIINPNHQKVIQKGDIAYFRANEEHGFKNDNDKPSEFYCIIGCLEKGENCVGI